MDCDCPNKVWLKHTEECDRRWLDQMKNGTLSAELVPTTNPFAVMIKEKDDGTSRTAS